MNCSAKKSALLYKDENILIYYKISSHFEIFVISFLKFRLETMKIDSICANNSTDNLELLILSKFC